MTEKDTAYYHYLLTSEVGQDRANAHRQIICRYFWGIFNKYGCKEVLDVGCGLGFFISKATEGANPVGIDSNFKAIEHCRKNGNISIVGNAVEIPIGSGKMDGVMCAHLLEHLTEPEKAFIEFHRVLKDNGILIVRVPPFNSSFYDDWTHIRPFTEKSLIRLASFCGFNVIKVDYYHYDLPFLNWENISPRLLNRIRHLPIIQFVINTLIRLKGLPPNELVLIARKGKSDER